MNILIVKLSAIGDVIHTLPALNAIRSHFPDAHITWLVEEAAASLVEGHEALDHVLVSKRKRWMRGLGSSLFFSTISETYRFIKALRDTYYDMILDFQALLKSGVLIGLARGQRKIGFGKGLEHMEHSYIFLNERIPAVDMEIHALSRGMMFIEALGIPSNTVEYKLPVSSHDHEKVDDLMRRYGLLGAKTLIAINPVAKWETKLWANKKFSQLADMFIHRYDAKIVFTGGPDDRPTIQDIMAAMKGHAANLAGHTTLKMLAALYEKMVFVVSTDTGPMHMAAAVGTSVVALFGPTAPWRTGPFGSIHQIVRAELDCAPCFKRECKTIDCMEQISVQQVIDAIHKLGIVLMH
ncbi:MAG: lipopolysaccharide heptosyltransferase II [Deltaproteobacteria bacterium]|nr:lipopolysaccharide heptosyltransferase II [Deltaproteobacteria bacterium]